MMTTESHIHSYSINHTFEYKEVYKKGSLVSKRSLWGYLTGSVEAKNIGANHTCNHSTMYTLDELTQHVYVNRYIYH